MGSQHSAQKDCGLGVLRAGFENLHRAISGASA
jgi:hypothetical protein